ncbi:MAG: DegT/DnrJ/EryC1/StrS family aminotransferase [Gemmatimonadetes bacterium]|nr:DegT/DnrJ/EryC1/StrS family aminotransferase [Gemmatimonadota bacterium]
MSWRRLPPVHSPLSAAAIGAGFGAALIPARAALARAEVEQWLQATYAPAAWRWTDSGTSALALALRLASEEGRRPVALPAYGCYDLATACDAAGVRVFLYDVDPATLGPDWASLEQALQAGAGVVVAVHLYGVPVDLDRLAELAGRHGAVVVEDAAQGIGGSWRGRPLGAHGALSVLSFGRGKGNTSGGGGALLVHDARYAGQLPDLPPGGAGMVAVAKTGVQYLLARPALYAIPASLPFLGLGETVYHPAHPPRGMSSSGFGLLSRSLLEVDGDAAVRRRNAVRLTALIGRPVRPASPSAGGNPGHLRFPVVVDPDLRPSALEAGRRLGLQPGYPTSLPALGEPFVSHATAQGTLPGATLLARAVVTAPVHAFMSESELALLAMMIRQALPRA